MSFRVDRRALLEVGGIWSSTPGFGGDETGTRQSRCGEGAARQPLFCNLAFKLTRGVRLDVVFDALLRGPDLGLHSKAGVVRDLDVRGGCGSNPGKGGGADERSIQKVWEQASADGFLLTCCLVGKPGKRRASESGSGQRGRFGSSGA